MVEFDRADHASTLVAVRSCRMGSRIHEDGFGLLASDDTISAAGFSAWVNRLIMADDSSMRDDPKMRRWLGPRRPRMLDGESGLDEQAAFASAAGRLAP